MKKYIGVIILIMFLYGTSRADWPPIVKYKVKLEMVDSSFVEGYYFYPKPDHTNNISNNLDSIFNNLDKYQNDTIVIYEELYTLDSLTILDGPKYASTAELTKFVNVNNIKNSTAINKSSFPWTENYILTELTIEEIKIAKNSRPKFMINYLECLEDDLTGIYIISYDQDLDKQNIRNIINENCCYDSSGEMIPYELRKEGYLRVKNELSKRGIITIMYCTGN